MSEPITHIFKIEEVSEILAREALRKSDSARAKHIAVYRLDAQVVAITLFDDAAPETTK